MPLKMGDDRLAVERLHLQAEMVHVPALARGRRTALQPGWTVHRHKVDQRGAGFARVLGREVRMEVVPRATWEALFKSQGMKNPTPRIQMLDGFNAGWIDFESDANATPKGSVQLDSVLRELVARAA